MYKLKSVIKKILSITKNGKELFHYFWLSLRHCTELNLQQNNLSNINDNDIILFCTLRNEVHRIPFFLKYYRELGVSHFIFVDNASDDGFTELVTEESDISVYFTDASYKASNFGMHWLNYLLRKHGQQHWCLTCDPDEFIVFPRMDDLDLKDLTTYLDSNHRISFFTTMLDMYGKGNIKDANYIPGTNPLIANPYFDKTGYFYKENWVYNSLWVQGGVRLRTLFQDNPAQAPALNKTPLIKWKWYYSYISSMHTAVPRRINKCYKEDLTGALLHFKFIAAFENKIVEEMERGEHYGDSREYVKYQQFLKDSTNYSEGVSIAYEDWRQLIQLGLIRNEELL